MNAAVDALWGGTETPSAISGTRNHVTPELSLQSRDTGAPEKQWDAVWTLITFLKCMRPVAEHRASLVSLVSLSDLLGLSRLSDTFANSHAWNLRKKYPLILRQLGFPGGSVVRICLQRRRCRFNRWVGKIPWSRKWQPSPVFLTEKPHEQKSLGG